MYNICLSTQAGGFIIVDIKILPLQRLQRESNCANIRTLSSCEKTSSSSEIVLRLIWSFVCIQHKITCTHKWDFLFVTEWCLLAFFHFFFAYAQIFSISIKQTRNWVECTLFTLEVKIKFCSLCFPTIFVLVK